VKQIGKYLALAVTMLACVDASAPVNPSRLAPFLAPGFDLTSQLIPDEYVVILNAGESDVPGAARHSGGQVLAVWEKAVKGYGVRANAGQLNAIRNDPRVRFVEPNALVTTIATQTPVPSWGLDRIDQAALPLNNSYTYPNTGAGVHAYIIDTGIRATHNEFTGRVGNSADFVTTGGTAADCAGHGTHVSGTVGGTTYGVAKGVTLHAVRVLDCAGSGTFVAVINGVNWVAANRIQPSVANLSLGGGFSSAINAAVAGMVAAGTFTAVASGNSNASACNSSPASEPSAMTVNASTITDARASFSNFGTCTDIFAPGQNITSAWIGSNTATNTISGTSMASPHAAGAGALYLSANPGATPAQVDAALKTGAVLNVITNPGTGSPNRLLNISFIGGGTPGNVPPVANFGITCNTTATSSTCSATSTSTDDAGAANLTFSWTNDVGRPAKTGQVATYYVSGHYPNTFNVTLTATDGGGLTNSITKTMTIPATGSQPPPGNQPPLADFTIACSAVTRVCTLDAAPSSDDGGFGNLTFAWANDVGRPAKTGQVATYYVSGHYPNTFNVTLTVTDTQGLNHSVTKQVVVP
jgi:subtilisin family serine protease